MVHKPKPEMRTVAVLCQCGCKGMFNATFAYAMHKPKYAPGHAPSYGKITRRNAKEAINKTIDAFLAGHKKRGDDA